jgi:hypothetical protein
VAAAWHFHRRRILRQVFHEAPSITKVTEFLNCTFQSRFDWSNGGAILWSTATDLDIRSCLFLEYQGWRGGATRFNGSLLFSISQTFASGRLSSNNAGSFCYLWSNGPLEAVADASRRAQAHLPLFIFTPLHFHLSQGIRRRTPCH